MLNETDILEQLLWHLKLMFLTLGKTMEEVFYLNIKDCLRHILSEEI